MAVTAAPSTPVRDSHSVKYDSTQDFTPDKSHQHPQSPPPMPYLIFPPDATQTTKPTYAVCYPDPADEIILKDFRKWGWTVVETTQTDPKWLTAVREYHARMKAPTDEEGVAWLSLWDYWRGEKARREAEKEATRRRGRLVKGLRESPAGSQRSGSLGLGRRRGVEEVVGGGGSDEVRDQNDERMDRVSAPMGGRRTMAQLRRDTTQGKEKSEDWNTPNHARGLGPLHSGHSHIYRYENESESKTLAEVRTQLDRETTQEIENWGGFSGILETTQVSVYSEEGTCVDDKGEQVSFPPKYQLPLFAWEEEVSRTGSTKSQGSSGKGPLECVKNELNGVAETADEK